MLVVGTLAYAGSYFARGWLAGHEHFGLYGGLVLMESISRICFALAVALGITSGQTAVALGIAAAPFVSLVVVPAAFARSAATSAGARGAARRRRRRERARRGRRAGPITVDEADAALAGPGTEGVQEAAAHDELSLRRGAGFAGWVSGIMLSEQTLLNAAVLTVAATSHNNALAGIVFNVLLIARAPLQLFQAIQTSLLPHLTGLEATAGHEAFARAIRITVLAIAAFAAAVALGLLVIGPFVMGHVFFGQHYSYGRFGLALVGVGMGLHLTSGALNQAALARDRARAAAACWVLAAVRVPRLDADAGGRRTAAAHRDRLRRRDGAARAAAVGCSTARGSDASGRRSAQAALDRRGDRAVGLAGVRRGEDRRARDEHVRAGLAGTQGAVCGSMPPSTSTATSAPTIARTRGSFSSECAMNGCPPQPGLTVMHSAMSIAPGHLRERAHGGPRVDRQRQRTRRVRGSGWRRRRRAAWPRRGR